MNQLKCKKYLNLKYIRPYFLINERYDINCVKTYLYYCKNAEQYFWDRNDRYCYKNGIFMRNATRIQVAKPNSGV